MLQQSLLIIHLIYPPKAPSWYLMSHIWLIADIHSPQTVENLRHNPSTEINVVDPFRRRGYRFKGIAEIISIRQINLIKLFHTTKNLELKALSKSIILVKIEKISEVLSPLYDLGYTEEELKTKWKKHYKF